MRLNAKCTSLGLDRGLNDNCKWFLRPTLRARWRLMMWELRMEIEFRKPQDISKNVALTWAASCCLICLCRSTSLLRRIAASSCSSCSNWAGDSEDFCCCVDCWCDVGDICWMRYDALPLPLIPKLFVLLPTITWLQMYSRTAMLTKMLHFSSQLRRTIIVPSWLNTQAKWHSNRRGCFVCWAFVVRFCGRESFALLSVFLLLLAVHRVRFRLLCIQTFEYFRWILFGFIATPFNTSLAFP